MQFFRLKPYKTAFFEVAISKFDILKSPLLNNFGGKLYEYQSEGRYKADFLYQNKCSDMINYINDHKNPIIVTQHGEARGVLLDVESYQNMVNALSLMKLLQVSEKAIQDGKIYNNKEVFSTLRAKIGSKND